MTDPAAARSGAAPQRDDLIEALAAREHKAWTGWMEHVFSRLDWVSAMLVIPADAEIHWKRQMATAYADLSEAEKESDRKEAREILAIIEPERAALAAARLAVQQALRDYGQHRLTCGAIKRKTNSFHLEERDGELTTVDDSVTTQGQCDCGLADALKTEVGSRKSEGSIQRPPEGWNGTARIVWNELLDDGVTAMDADALVSIVAGHLQHADAAEAARTALQQENEQLRTERDAAIQEIRTMLLRRE